MIRYLSVFAISLAFWATAATAEVISATPSHFTLKMEAVAEAPPEQVWAKLIHPARWWSSDHTYSGDAENLTLELRPGGLWREDWAGHGVEHGRVLFFEENEGLRLEAPFGPLQAMAVQAVWSITLTPEDDGQRTRVTFEFVCNGSDQSRLDEVAPAVDYVKTQALAALVSGF
ncbi:MAG: SRPBCC family protein [Parvularcula sp.]